MVRISAAVIFMFMAFAQPVLAQICPAGSTLVISSFEFSNAQKAGGKLTVNAAGGMDTRRQLFNDFRRSELFGPGGILNRNSLVEYTAPLSDALGAMRSIVANSFAEAVRFDFQLLPCSMVNSWTVQSAQKGLCVIGRRKLGFHVQTGTRIRRLDLASLPFEPASCLLRSNAGYARPAAPVVASSPLKRTLEHCLPVSARRGWQRLSIQPSAIIGARTRGAWSVDAARFPSVGPEGHLGSAAVSLAPYNKFKFAGNEPFGILLLRFPDGRLASYGNFKSLLSRATVAGGALAYNGQWIDFRINDSDASLGDNDGAITVCIAVK